MHPYCDPPIRFWNLPCSQRTEWSTPFVSSSTSFWHQFFHFRLTYSVTHHFFLFWFTTLYFYNCLSLSLPTLSFTNPTPVVILLPPKLPPRTIAWTNSSELLGFCFLFIFIFSPYPNLRKTCRLSTLSQLLRRALSTPTRACLNLCAIQIL